MIKILNHQFENSTKKFMKDISGFIIPYVVVSMGWVVTMVESVVNAIDDGSVVDSIVWVVTVPVDISLVISIDDVTTAFVTDASLLVSSSS